MRSNGVAQSMADGATTRGDTPAGVAVREGAVKDVERRVVPRVLRRRQVVREVLQLQAHRVAVVVAAYLHAGGVPVRVTGRIRVLIGCAWLGGYRRGDSLLETRPSTGSFIERSQNQEHSVFD